MKNGELTIKLEQAIELAYEAWVVTPHASAIEAALDDALRALGEALSEALTSLPEADSGGSNDGDEED
jgi:hypothetical protein